MNQVMIRPNQQLTMQQMLSNELAFAEAACKSGLLPASLDTPQKALAIILKGQEFGLKRMQSFRHLFVVNGQIGMDTALLTALYQKRGNSFEVIEKTAERCTIKFIRRIGSAFTYTMTMAEARQANWPMAWDRQTNQWKEKATWRSMPAIMLFNRTLSDGIRTVDPGCVFGTLSEDELYEQTDSYPTSGRTIEGQAAEETETPGEPGRQLPEPDAGWATWPQAKQRAFWAMHARAGLAEDDVLAEYGVVSMGEWQYSIDQTRPVLELLESLPELTTAQKKQALDINQLAEIVWNGWSKAECLSAVQAVVRVEETAEV